INPLPMMERTVLFYDFHRQYRMPRSQNVLRLGQNRSLGPTGPTKGAPAKPAHHGDAGWEDRFSDPGRPKAASRRGEAPRGGAFPLGILLKEESLSKLSRPESGFFGFCANG
ncbi:hypothetical protein F4U94_22755, partial [Sphingobium limneticum]